MLPHTLVFLGIEFLLTKCKLLLLKFAPALTKFATVYINSFLAMYAGTPDASYIATVRSDNIDF